LSLGAGGFFVGDRYTVAHTVKASGADGTVAGLDFSGLPAGYEAEIMVGCGATVAAGSAGTLVRVQVRRVAEGASGSWSLAEDAAVLAVRNGETSPSGVTGCGSPYVGGAAS
jgi:hypothetical protein